MSDEKVSTAPKLVVPRIQIAPSDRVFVAGATGSGKTHLIAHMAKRFPNVIVFDDKGTFPEIGKRHSSLFGLMRERGGRFIYTPKLGSELFNDEATDRFYRWGYERGNTIVITDEAYAVTNGQNLPYHMRAVITRGREKVVGSWALSQRPKNIPNYLISEADHIFVFRLSLEDDLKKLAGVVGDAVFEPLGEFQFHYFNIKENTHLISRVGADSVRAPREDEPTPSRAEA